MSWFNSWFNSPYYHILYSNHDLLEASRFVTKLAEFLDIRPAEKVLDLACGTGRHSIFLSKMGFDVEGIDLSENNIKIARENESTNLHFALHDMRQVYKPGYFHYVLNLFTSFGYFELETDNQKAITAAGQNLKPNGKLIIDFMNTPLVVSKLINEQTVTKANIDFHISKRFRNDTIIKSIRFTDKGQNFSFQEEVKAVTLEHFSHYFKKASLELLTVRGNYNLEEYIEAKSERMILVVQKPA